MRSVWPLLAVLLGVGPDANTQPAVTKYQVVSPKDDGIIATAINGRGEIVGFEWVEPKDLPGVLAQMPFHAQGKRITYLPLLAGYTASFPAAVSDEGVVVGRVSKPLRPRVRVDLQNQAFVWDAESGIHGLGVLEGDAASFACGISRDGRRISGYSVGPDRVRACLWDRAGAGWQSRALPHAARLGSNVVAISDNGKYVAAVDGVVPCRWTQSASGEWTREEIAEAGALIPRAVNDMGTVVGVRFARDGSMHAALWTRAEGSRQLEEPVGYVRSEANAVNNAGTVVGMVDGPNGSKIGPNAFVYEGGRMRLMDEGGPAFTAATAINDHAQVAGVMEKDEEPARAASDPKKP